MSSIPVELIDWLMAGDPSVQWQVQRDLLKVSEDEQHKTRIMIELEGWGQQFLDHHGNDGLWGKSVSNPEWKGTIWVLDTLTELGIDPQNRDLQASCKMLLEAGIQRDGGINFFKDRKFSEPCFAGLLLKIVSYFGIRDPRRDSMYEYLVETQMDDGGWNCQLPYGATHSDFHTTLTVLRGLKLYHEKIDDSSTYINGMLSRAHEFLLAHNIFRSHQTGMVADEDFLTYKFPIYNRYDILTVMDYFRSIDLPIDMRMIEAIRLIKSKEYKGRWVLEALHPGETWFDLETVGTQSRMNTLRALRVINWWDEKSKMPRPLQG